MHNPRMRLLKRILLGLLALVVVAASALGGAFVYFTRAAFPQTSGTLALPGLGAPVEVVRDRFGVPHIYADTTADLFMAQGFVHAQDRFFQMEFSRRIGQGRIAELFGAGALPQDKYIRTLGWHHVAAEEARTLPPDARAVLEAYAAGVNAYALPNADRLGFEFRVLQLIGRDWTPEPWQPVHSLTWGKAMAFNLGDNSDQELVRAAVLARGGEALADAVMPPYPSDHPVIVPSQNSARAKPSAPSAALPDIASGALALARLSRSAADGLGFARGADIGSNNWVIAGSKTTSGKPILADDPHLGIQMPSIWYQVGLHCRTVSDACPYDVVGASFAGTPGVVIGHNARIAWGVTNGTVDTQDYFIERADPNDPDSFEFQGKFEKAVVREERIAVAGRAEPEVLRVRVTRHGPIMNDVEASLKDQQPMALAWTALRPGSLLQSVLAIDRAQNWDQFRDALRLWDVPSQNFVYADVDGNIGYQFPGTIPVRAAGDGTRPVPGWTGEFEWTGFVPFEKLPSRYNPPEGWIATANNAVVDADADVFLMARDWDFGYRARRIEDLLKSKDKFSVADVQAMHVDAYAVFADELIPVLEAAAPAGSGERIDGAMAVLRNWDRHYQRDSRGALLFEAVRTQLARAVFADELGDLAKDVLGAAPVTWTALRNMMRDENSPWWDDVATAEKETRAQIVARAIENAVADLTTRLGADQSQWRWGAMHRATFRNQTLGTSGIAPIEAIFNRGPFDADGGTGLVNAIGHRPDDFAVRSVPSLRMIVDLGDLSGSLLIHTTGQSGHTMHPRYDDFIDPWQNGRYHPLLWTREHALDGADGVLVLRP
jgi:penicillin amidase